MFIEILENDLWSNRPCKSLTMAARFLMSEFLDLPDWVGALAGANTENWEAAVDEIRRMNLAEEKS